MKKIWLLIVGVMALGFINVTLAWGGTSSSTNKVSVDRVAPMQNSNGVNYIFDQTWVKNLLNQKSTLLEINCNGTWVLKSLGFGGSASKIFSIGLTQWGFDYTFDVRNCSLRGSKVDADYNYTKSLTEKQALDFAEKRMKNSYLKDKIFYQLGKAMVIYRNNNGPIAYWRWWEWMVKATSSSIDLSDIEIDDSDPQNIDPEYTSFSILYPYLINGQEVWEQYGNRAWITLEVSANGVMSLNARLLPFKWITRNSEKLTLNDITRIINNGWNSPRRWVTKEVKFDKPQKVLVLFNLRRNNKNYLYLSSWIGLKTNLKADQYAQQPYTMIISDYKIGNTTQ